MHKDIYETSFGYFQNEGKEFVITEPNTPRALVNYFWNHCFISGVSHHGGGNGLYKNRAMQYIDPQGRNLLIRGGHRYFYIRDDQDRTIWSPGWHPVHYALDDYHCIHGFGYSIIKSAVKGIQSHLRVFVPRKDPCEIWTITLINTRRSPATLKFYSFADWYLMGYPRYCDYFGMLFGEYFEDIYAAQGCNRAAERTHEIFDGFIAADTKPSGFETSQRAFLGNYGFINKPEGVLRGQLTNSLASCENLASALEHHIDLIPDEQYTFHLIIGASSGYHMTREIVSSLFREGAIEEEFTRLQEQKQQMIDRVKISTPDKRVNFLINGWIKQQIQVYADVGSDNGRGFRDAMQLLWATASYDKIYTKKMLIECLSHQYADGHTLRGWLPIDDHHYSDGPVWITPVVDAYLKETGEYDLLNLEIPFFGGGQGTVWEHVLRGLRHGSDDTGAHGLTKCRFGDWNDSLTGVGIEGRGESVWTTIGIIYGLKLAARMAKIVRHNSHEADELNQRAERLKDAVDRNAWDGSWYLRAINDYDEKVGTHAEKEGWIYLLPQVWAIMAEIVTPDRRQLLYKMIDTHLETPYGSRTLYPVYTRYNPRIGRVTLLQPGMWENGSPYCHANGFKIIADCYGGRGNKAYQSFQKAMPDSAWNSSIHSGCEPYVLTNNYLGPDNRRAGKSLWAWMTGAAGWYYRAMTEWILGVRADYNGLIIDPCLPDDWDECELERSFRNARYQILIHNPNHLEKGKAEITVDGITIAGNLIPIHNDGKIHKITVVIKM